METFFTQVQNFTYMQDFSSCKYMLDLDFLLTENSDKKPQLHSICPGKLKSTKLDSLGGDPMKLSGSG